MEFRDIVVPLDGSRLAEHALPVAATLARRAEGCMRLIAVVPGASFMDPIDLPDSVSAGLEQSRRYLGQYIDDMVARLRRVEYVRVTGDVRVDAPIEGILDAAERHHAQLIVMTSHGRGGIQRAWLGSTADAIVRRAAVPVLILKPDTDIDVDLRDHPAYGSVLVPLDGSALGEAALEPAITLASLFGGSITLVQVVATPYALGPMPVSQGLGVDHHAWLGRREHAEAYLQTVAAALRARGITATPLVVEQDRVADAIMETARHGGGHVIALATHGIGGVKRMLVGSVADKVLRNADVPVLVTRPLETGAQDPTLAGELADLMIS